MIDLIWLTPSEDRTDYPNYMLVIKIGENYNNFGEN